MPLNYKAKGGGGDFKSVPAGSHIAVCNIVADLGLQPGSGLYPDPKQQVFIRFEVPEERVEYEKDGKKYEGPVVIGMTFTASMHEKANLRKQLESWRGKQFTDEQAESFDIESILGKACMISVVEVQKGDKVYSNIKSISGLPKGVIAPRAENPLLFYTAQEDSSYSKLPEWLQKKIDAQLERKETRRHDPSELEITDDDIPF